MPSLGILWAVLAFAAAWGSFHFARRDPRSTSWMKITFAGSLLVVTGTAPLWLRGDVIGEGLVAHFLLLAFWAMISVGAPLCVGSVAGPLAAMYRKQH
jgi:hypothetical protein